MIQVQHGGLKYLIRICNSQGLVPDKICRVTNHQKSEENTKHVLIYLLKSFSKPCIECLETSGLATIIHNECNQFFSFKSNFDYFHPKKFRLGSMAMITFCHVKQERLMHVGQFRIYNV